MYATVWLRDPRGEVHELTHGDVIGRVWSAALHLDDGRVSEAHAMVSLREGGLYLVTLRGSFAVDGRPVGRVLLQPGLVLQLARGVDLVVDDVRLPEEVLAVEGPGGSRQILPGVCSLVADGPSARLAPGWQEDGLAWLWSTGDGWRVRIDGVDAPLRPGDVLPGGLRAVAVPLADAGTPATRRAGELDAPLTVVAQFDNAHVQRAGRVVVVLPGKQGRLVSELVASGGPLRWQLVGALLWPEGCDELTLRVRLDTLLSKLRRRLRAAGLREDLVRTDGSGQVEVFLHPHDTVVDRT